MFSSYAGSCGLCVMTVAKNTNLHAQFRSLGGTSGKMMSGCNVGKFHATCSLTFWQQQESRLQLSAPEPIEDAFADRQGQCRQVSCKMHSSWEARTQEPRASAFPGLTVSFRTLAAECQCQGILGSLVREESMGIPEVPEKDVEAWHF